MFISTDIEVAKKGVILHMLGLVSTNRPWSMLSHSEPLDHCALRCVQGSKLILMMRRWYHQCDQFEKRCQPQTFCIVSSPCGVKIDHNHQGGQSREGLILISVRILFLLVWLCNNIHVVTSHACCRVKINLTTIKKRWLVTFGQTQLGASGSCSV